MTPAGSDALAALRDIRLPDAVGLWPPAPGWWALALLLLAAGVAAAVLIARRRRQRESRWQTASVRELERLAEAFRTSGDEVTLAAGLSALLRRIALARAPRRDVAALFGDAWFEFLSAEYERDRDTAVAIVRELTRAAYRGKPERGDAGTSADPQRWLSFVRDQIAEAS